MFSHGSVKISDFIAAEPTEESAELQKQTRAHSILVADQKSVLSRAVDGFVTVLDDTDAYLSEEAWNNRPSWLKKEWEAMESWGWFRHFCRSVSSKDCSLLCFTNFLFQYAPHLRVYKESLSAAYLSRVPAERRSGQLMREIWSISVEQDS